MVNIENISDKREVWIDNIKVFACILVVVGHFFMSMGAANILDSTALYEWFISSIYTFHVQLFFICSGYLYQKNSKVNTIKEWKRNIIKKLIALGIFKWLDVFLYPTKYLKLKERENT